MSYPISKIFIALIGGITFFLIGIICLFWPEKIQELGINYYNKHKVIAKINPFIDYLKSPAYVSTLRIIGIFTVGASLLLFFVLIKLLSSE